MQSPIEAAAHPRADWKSVLDLVPRAALRLALVLAAALPATSHSPHELPVPGLLGELRAALPAPPIAPRLSVATRHLPCPARARPGETVPRAECAPPPPSRALSAVAARAGAAVHASADPDALHVLGVVDLPWAGASGNRLDESISMLRRAARMSARPAPVLADLSAAHLVRAEARQTPRDLVEALEAAEAAAELSPGHPAVLFNRALALDRLALDGQAAQAWRAYLVVDPHSGWAEEARARVRALEAPRALRPALADGATTRAAAAFAALAPQAARVHGWERLLGRWGEEVLSGRADRAELTLRLVEAMGNELERRGGDASLADAVRAIRAHAGDPAATRTLADAHRAYARGAAAFEAGRRDSAEVNFAAALASAGASPALARWAAAHRAGMLVVLSTDGRRERGERLLEAELAGIDAARHPALAARARWILGTAALRTGRHARALELYRAAAGLFARAGEREHQGAMEGLAAETRFKAGETAGGFAMMHRALTTLRPYRDSGWLHNLLYVSARAAEDAGLLRAAIRVQDEDLVVAARAWPPALPEAYLIRARMYGAAGKTREAVEDIRAGRGLLGRAKGDSRKWLEADLRLAGARASLLSDPARSAAAMDSVLDYFRDEISLSRWLDAMVLRADARVRLGSAARAGDDLERIADKLEEQRALADSVRNPAAVLDAARGVFDRLVMLHASAGRAGEALRYLERARASLSVVGAGPAPRRLGAPAGQVAVEYALVGDTLLTWTVSGATVRMARDTVDRAALLLAVEKARSLEIPGAAVAAAPALGELYERLLRPVEGWLGREGTPLVIVADGELADAPFAALHDRRRDRYLVEFHPLRVTGSLRDGSGTSPARAPPAGDALLVADPAFDRAAHPDLQPLAGAAAEVEALSAVYPRARVVRGAAAGREAVEAGLGRAAVVHFAGHAVFDAERPERSFLVLAPSAGGGGGRLSAAEIERLDLGHVRLVVLSACQTLRGRTGRSGGISGLSGALLGAGAGGVVGSLWQVRDESTRALMAEFHRAYAASGDGAAALRQAQLRLLRSGDPELASPAAWAGFRYAGR